MDTSIRRMKKISLYFPLKLLRMLKLSSEASGAPASEIVRRATQYFLEKEKKRKK
jgi:hypothetical protein